MRKLYIREICVARPVALKRLCLSVLFCVVLSPVLLGCQATPRTEHADNIDSLPTPLTAQSGDIARGRALFASREGGHCVLCHQLDGLEVAFQGNLGPSLNNIGARFSPAQLRMRIVDYDRIKPGVAMPSYYRQDGLNQVEDRFVNQTVLSAQDIEDIIAYLGTIKS